MALCRGILGVLIVCFALREAGVGQTIPSATSIWGGEGHQATSQVALGEFAGMIVWAVSLKPWVG